MAEDNMEISYDEHGDDDIDINIDIDQENQDEDYMIEDANSDAGTHDDVMVDEDNTSFAMEDDDYMPDHTLDNAQAEVVEITEVEMTRAVELETPTFDNLLSSGNGLEETQELEVQQADSNQPQQLVPATQRESITPEEAILPVAATGSTPEHKQDRLSSPEKLVVSDEVLKTDAVPSSPPRTNQQDDRDQEDEATTTQRTVKQDLVSEDRSVIVQYNDTEYALVSSSETDDPDSYFLQNSNVLKEPLSIFFAVIREILGEEIAPEDELCLCIDDLGLETYETCISNNNVTFSQIVDVHTTLLRNDGPSEMSPLYITLSTKPDFGRSFAKMTEDAKHGQRLSAIMEVWDGDDGTDVWAVSEHGPDEISGAEDEDHNQNEHTRTGQALNEDPSADENAAQTGDEEHHNQSAGAEVQVASGQAHEEAESKSTELANGNVQEQPEQGPSAGEQMSQGAHLTGAQPDLGASEETFNTPDRHDDVQDEEGDLIDYEDDDYAPAMAQSKAASRRVSDAAEDLSSPCLKPAACFCSSCNQQLLAKYAEINEKLERSRRSSRSSSQTLEGSNGDGYAKPVHQDGADTDGNADLPGVPTTEIVEVTQLDQTTTQSEEYAIQDELNIEQGSYEDVDDVEHGEGDEHEEQAEGDQYSHEDYTNYDEEAFDNQPQVEPNGDLDTATFGDSFTEQAAGLAADKDEDEISYEDDAEVPMPHQAPTTSEDNAPLAVRIPSQAAEDHEDEIDYDDDDHEEAHALESETVTAVPQHVTGKRPYDEPDALGFTSQEAKRARA